MTRATLKRLAREAFFEGMCHESAAAVRPMRPHDEAHFELWWARQRPGLDDSAGP